VLAIPLVFTDEFAFHQLLFNHDDALNKQVVQADHLNHAVLRVQALPSKPDWLLKTTGRD
jgi:hypothetical protein